MTINVPYTIAEIIRATGGTLLHENISIVSVNYIALDSRKITSVAETIFFAITTSHQDGNSFIEALYKKGIRNFVTDNKRINVFTFPQANIILVKNTVTALQKLAIHHRNQFKNLTVIGITGSNGKTVVKEWLSQLLEKDIALVRSPKSYNSQIGVPLSVLHITGQSRLAIFEAGISQPGEMQQLEKIIKPAIGLLTNIGEAHDSGFTNTSQKIYEKLQLFINAKHLIFCTDIAGIKEAVYSFQKKIKNKQLKLFTWGKEKNNTLQISSVNKRNTFTKIEGVYAKEKIAISIPFTDDASIENAINCWCVLLLLHKNDMSILQRFELLYPIAMRLELKQGIHNCTIINDCYSNDVHSLTIALSFLAQQKQHKKYTVILSDILQSGKRKSALYNEIANLLKHQKINRLIAVGPDIFSQRNKFSFLKEAHFFLSTGNFIAGFKNLNFENETILIKGSRSFGFEEISNKLEQKAHQTVLSINLTAIAYNLKQYKLLLKPQTKIMAMVKAFSYGSGGFEIASVLENNKVDYLAVAYADEGVELRNAGITLPVMVMNAEAATFTSIVNNNLEPEIFSFNILLQFENFLKSAGINNYPVHIKIDTGMHRLGFTIDDMDILNEKLRNNHFIKVVTAFTHLVASDNKEEDYFTQQQAKTFQDCCITLERSLGYKIIKHVSNTAGISRHKNLQMDMVRLGIGLYGIDSNKTMQQKLSNVTTLSTTISQIKKVKKGETVGYGRNAKLTRNCIIATVRIGYADGYPRNLGNGKGKMLVQNMPATVAGNVCMDMTMLDVTGLENINEGDQVIVFGEALPLDILANWADTIPYELMTGISQRVKRIYFEE